MRSKVDKKPKGNSQDGDNPDGDDGDNPDGDNPDGEDDSDSDSGSEANDGKIRVQDVDFNRLHFQVGFRLSCYCSLCMHALPTFTCICVCVCVCVSANVNVCICAFCAYLLINVRACVCMHLRQFHIIYWLILSVDNFNYFWHSKPFYEHLDYNYGTNHNHCIVWSNLRPVKITVSVQDSAKTVY